MSIQDNYLEMTEAAGAAAEALRRNPGGGSVLLAVTENTGPTDGLRAIDAGATDFSESQVQKLPSNIVSPSGEWHLIGHLQTNKVLRLEC